MKVKKSLLTVLLSLVIAFMSTSYCFAQTGSAYTSIGSIGGYSVQGYLIISSYNVEVKTGYVSITGQPKAYFGYNVTANYRDMATGATSYRNGSYNNESLGVGGSFSAYSNCIFTSGNSYHSAYLSGQSWSADLIL